MTPTEQSIRLLPIRRTTNNTILLTISSTAEIGTPVKVQVAWTVSRQIGTGQLSCRVVPPEGDDICTNFTRMH